MCKKRNGSLGKKRSGLNDSDVEEELIPEHLYNPYAEEPKKDDKTEFSEYYLAGKILKTIT